MKLRLLPLLLFIGIGTWKADGAEGPWSIGKDKWVKPEYKNNVSVLHNGTFYEIFPDSSSAQDFVDAMNEAHERRQPCGKTLPNGCKICGQDVYCPNNSPDSELTKPNLGWGSPHPGCAAIDCSDDHDSGLRPEK